MRLSAMTNNKAILISVIVIALFNFKSNNLNC